MFLIGGKLEQECNIGDNLVLEYIKRDNLAQNSTTSGNDDCDSGYSNRSSFIDVESENSPIFHFQHNHLNE
jgi:hypothetical protein